MKYLKSVFALLAFTAVLSSCDPTDFGDINKDPNNPSDPSTSFMFTYACRYLPNFIFNSATYDPWVQEWPGYMAESKNNQFGILGSTNTYSTSGYYLYAIKNLQYIIDFNQDEEIKNEVYVTALGSSNNQIAVAKTLQAFFFMTMSDILGPIVYSEALQGASLDNWKPKYDKQQDIYAGLDAQLKEAYSMFDVNGDFSSSADIVFFGDIAKWKKFNASIRMLMAIKLTDVDPATGQSRFAAAYADGGMQTVADGAYYTFDANNYATGYSSFNVNYGSADNNFVPNAFIVDTLKAYKDNRLFSYCDLEGYRGSRPGNPNDFDAYIGTPHGLVSNASVNAYSTICCCFDARLAEQQAVYPLIPTARILFAEAEAAYRGWISADAKSLYEAGIRASFEQWEADGVEAYIASDKVAYNPANGLYQIAIQRWIASFFSDGIEAWSDWRRLDIPYLPIGPGVTMISHYPYRLGYYADTDVAYNYDNLQVAMTDLSDGKDTRSGRVWWDVADNREGVLHDWLNNE